MDSTITEKQALQNWAGDFGLEVVCYNYEDKRKKQKYFLTKNNMSVSPPLSYTEMNCFLNGIHNCKKHQL